MSIAAFASLNEQEIEQMVDSISQVTVLIAGADGEIDSQETAWAEKIAKIRTYSTPEPYQEFYKLVGQDYSDRVAKLIGSLPKETQARQSALSDQLSGLNEVLAKLEVKWAAGFYKDLVLFANHVAKASGGIMGFLSVSADEKKWMDLPMVNEIIYEEES